MIPPRPRFRMPADITTIAGYCQTCACSVAYFELDAHGYHAQLHDQPSTERNAPEWMGFRKCQIPVVGLYA